ncbi:MAG TPA: CotH kinase family protein [Chitinophagales bacterium]|nr:CotH kinase family protein [Chitinophagales bacterium]
MRSISIVILVLLGSKLFSQSFYDLNTIQDIRIFFSYADWDYRLDTAYAGAGEYIMADSVVVNGTTFANCGVRYKGNSSYDAARSKNPLHIKLDEYVEQDYQGYEDIKLGNGYSDNSMSREPLSYAILRQYMDAPESNFAHVYINGSYYGIMNNTESIDSRFLLDKYYSSKYTFVKCNPPGSSPGGGNGSNLEYSGTSQANYNTKYELKSDTGWYDLFHLCDTLNNHFSSFNAIADIDRFLWMLAFNNALVNLDSYSGTFRQNYYLYRNHAGQWIPTIWDLNMCFGGFSIAGGVTSNLTPAAMQTMSYTLHKSENGWPLIYKLLNDTLYSKMYYAHLRTINNENFVNASYKALAEDLHGMVDTAVLNDVNFLGTYTDYQNSLTTNTTAAASGGISPGLYPLMDGRASYLSNVLSAQPPVISNVNSGSVTTFGATTIISASVSNSTAVYLGYRYSKSDRFTRITMYDDGAHGDGGAGDNVFGASLPLNSLGIQYYIYADNQATGAFSPERAEYEFYAIEPALTSVQPSQLVLNEVAPNNNAGIENENGKFKDWVEVYNSSGQTLGLSGLYLTDDVADLTKWNFPGKSFIQPYEHLIVWADDLDKTYLDLHTNFNLSGFGDVVLLTDGVNVIDSVSFGSTALNTGVGRCADATGAFTQVTNLTPETVNDCSTAAGSESTIRLTMYPNPATQYFVVTSEETIEGVDVFSLSGERMISSAAASVNIDALSAGCYLVTVTTPGGYWRGRLVKIQD